MRLRFSDNFAYFEKLFLRLELSPSQCYKKFSKLKRQSNARVILWTAMSSDVGNDNKSKQWVEVEADLYRKKVRWNFWSKRSSYSDNWTNFSKSKRCHASSATTKILYFIQNQSKSSFVLVPLSLRAKELNCCLPPNNNEHLKFEERKRPEIPVECLLTWTKNKHFRDSICNPIKIQYSIPI